MTDASLVVTDLHVEFSGFVAVDGVSFDAHLGEVRFLIGPNGAGKTTCIDAITGLSKATGSARLGEQELLGRPVHKIVRLGVGRTFQTASVFDELSVLQNLDIAAGRHRHWASLLRTRRGVDPSIVQALEETGLAGELATPAGILSHGQKQWLEIAMLLVQDARVLLLDEPVAGMSQDERTATGELLQRVAAKRIVLVVEHDMDFMRRFATRVTVLHQGKVLSHGTVAEVQADPKVQEVYLGTAGAATTAAMSVVPDVASRSGSQARRKWRPGRRSRRRTDMLELTDIEAGYGRTRVLHGVTVPAGKVVAVLGHNGAGKTTLLRVAIGLIKPSKGRVLFDGEDIASLAPNKRVARGMAYVPQGQQAFGQLTTLENLQLVADGRRRGKALIDAQLARFPALETFAARRAGLLSGGQRQQLAIARALITEPKLLILDEPTEGIQPTIVAEIEHTIMQLADEGINVLLVEQHIGFALEAAERYVVLASGFVTQTDEGGSAATSTVRAAMAI